MLVLLPLLLVVAPQDTPGSFSTGSDFYALCKDAKDDSPERTFCAAYIRGVSDGIQVGEWAVQLRRGEKAVSEIDCRPPTATLAQLIDIFLRYLRDKPDRRHNPIAALYMIAVREAYPCPASAKP